MQVIIVAALSLVVMLILIGVFTGKVRFFNRQVGETCADMNGKCMKPDKTCGGDKPIKIWSNSCGCVDNDDRTLCESLGVMIAFIVALIVLVVLLVMLGQRYGFFHSNVFSCESHGGTCVQNPEACGTDVTVHQCPDKESCCMGS